MNKKIAKKIFAVFIAAAMIIGAAATDGAVINAAAKTVTVRTQKELSKALKTQKSGKIVIKTNKSLKINVKSGSYKKITLVVDSSNLKLNNSGKFKSITVKNAAAVKEKADNNKITVTDSKLKIEVAEGADNSKITVAKANSKVEIVANGNVAAVTVNKKATVDISGSAEEPVKITNNAAGSSITASAKADLVLNESTDVVVANGAKIGSVTANADADIKVAGNATVKSVVVSGTDSKVNLTADGTIESVAVNAKADVAVSGSTDKTVSVAVNAANASVATEVKSDVSVNADVKVDLKGGAEGSSVKTTGSDVKADVSNNTAGKVNVTDSTGKNTSVESGKTQTVTDTAKPSGGTGGTTAGGGSSSSGSSSSGGSSSGGSSSGGSSSGGGNTDPPTPIDTTTIYTGAGTAKYTILSSMTQENIYTSEIKKQIKLTGRGNKTNNVITKAPQTVTLSGLDIASTNSIFTVSEYAFTVECALPSGWKAAENSESTTVSYAATVVVAPSDIILLPLVARSPSNQDDEWIFDVETVSGVATRSGISEASCASICSNPAIIQTVDADGNVCITLTAGNLLKHVNANGDNGYWFGFGLKVDTGYTVKRLSTDGTPTGDSITGNIGSNLYYTQYLNAGTTSKTATIRRNFNSSNSSSSATITFKLDWSGVTCDTTNTYYAKSEENSSS